MTGLCDFIDGLEDLLPSPPIDPPQGELTRFIRLAVTSSEFLCDLATKVIDTASDPTWSGEPLFDLPGRQAALRMFVWPPDTSSGLHKHLDWTATGVLRGALAVETFATDGLGMVPTARYLGKAGEVGFLSAPCVHCVSNEAGDWAVSLHVFGGRAISGGPGTSSRGRTEVITPPTPSSYLIGECQLIGAAELASGLDVAVATSLLKRIAHVAPPRAALHAVSKLIQGNKGLAGELALAIADRLKGIDAVRIRGLAATLLDR